ncbi:MAG: hypothetical protein J6W84_08680 [Bacteroidales bacterium]|nr:hypothetical protein [Bacteroidales bacterium]
MKALSYDAEYAWRILTGEKTIDCRTVPTVYRGPVLVCSGARLKFQDRIHGYALCVATIADVVPFTEEHLQPAMMDTMPTGARYAWAFSDIKPIQPFKISGRVGLFEAGEPDIKYMHVPQVGSMTDEQFALYAEKFYLAYYFPLIYPPNTNPIAAGLAYALSENTDLLYANDPLPQEVEDALGGTYKCFINGNKPMKEE